MHLKRGFVDNINYYQEGSPQLTMSPLSTLCPSVPPGSLEGLPKRELEQRLRSHMINVEVLLQQLDAARVQKSPPAGPPPSQLRDVLVQTDHTELNQVRPDILPQSHMGTQEVGVRL